MVNTLKKKRFNYGYVIIGLSFLALFVTMGIRGSFGTYLTAWEETFSVGRLSVSFVSFVSLLVYGSSMVAAGKLADRIGTRKVLSLSMLILGVCLSASFFATNIWHMVIIYGIFGSIGFGFGSNVTVSVAIVKWFKEKKGLAVSFVVLGMAAGPMIYSPINLIVIDNIGWQWLFLIYGSIYTFLFLPLFLIFFIDSPNDKKNKNNKKTSKTIPN